MITEPSELECEFETVSIDWQGVIVERRTRRVRQLTEDLGNGVVLAMVVIPGGTFAMGSPAGFGYDDEHPQHEVAVASFLIAQFPVTQEQWEAVMGTSPLCRFQGRGRPVENVSWHDAGRFCERLSQRTGRGYRLPSEAEWEYACRAGTRTPFSCGETITTDLANYNGEYTFGSEPKGVYRHATTEVGGFPPNAFGLHDMQGNLWEWCADPWHEDYRGAPEDGTVWESGADISRRVLRGGSWHDPPDCCRCAVRLKFAPGEGDDFVGFRVVLS